MPMIKLVANYIIYPLLGANPPTSPERAQARDGGQVQSAQGETQPRNDRRNEQPLGPEQFGPELTAEGQLEAEGRNPGPDLAYNLNGLIKAHSTS